MNSYLALVPRGLQHVVQSMLHEQLTRDGRSTMTVRVDVVGQVEYDYGADGDRDESEAKYAQQMRDKLVAHQSSQQRKGKKRARQNESTGTATCRAPTGTMHVDQTSTLSVGYDDTRIVWNTPGALQGVVWLRIVTNAPTTLVDSVRCVGPLLLLVDLWEEQNVNISESQSIDQALQVFQQHCKQDMFDSVLQVWERYVMDCWNLTVSQKESIRNRLSGKEPVRYRLSCLRNDSKSFSYSRQELLTRAASFVIPDKFGKTWIVDLENYDIEIVLLLRSNRVAIGLATRPYQYLGAKSFDKGALPPDVSRPYLSGQVLSKVLRLRPSTAQILLHQAKLQPGDVVLDPCVGIGTIPLEATLQGIPVYAVGGDLVLGHNQLGPIAARYVRECRTVQRTESQSSGAADLLVWDACLVPMRDGCVDVIVSDLPFGQTCLSSGKLSQMMTLLFSELARLLRPASGRMVLLCGAHVPILEELRNANHRIPNTWCLPCESIFPVNIGGILAWVVCVGRGTENHRQTDNHRERIKKLAQHRNRSKGNAKRFLQS